MIKNIVKFLLGEETSKEIAHKVAAYNLSRYGCDILEIVDKISSELKFDYWLIYGTLLGAYREHGFIKHDDDLDLAINANDITQEFIIKMLSNGFVLKSIKGTKDKRMRMVSFAYKKVMIDFYGYVFDDAEETKLTVFSSYPQEGKTYAESAKLNKFRCYLIHMDYNGIIRTQFKKLKVPIPANTEYVLKGLYGANFMIPDKKEKGQSATISEIPPLEKLQASIIDISQLPLRNNG